MTTLADILAERVADLERQISTAAPGSEEYRALEFALYRARIRFT